MYRFNCYQITHPSLNGIRGNYGNVKPWIPQARSRLSGYVIFLIVWGIALPALGTMCANPPPIESIMETPLIFRGRAISSQLFFLNRLVTDASLQTFKNPETYFDWLKLHKAQFSEKQYGMLEGGPSVAKDFLELRTRFKMLVSYKGPEL